MNGVLILIIAALAATAGFLVARWNDSRRNQGVRSALYTGANASIETATDQLPVLDRFTDSMARFAEWVDAQNAEQDFWPAFAEFVRATLNRCCRATHVKVYRVTANGRELTAIREASPLVHTDRISARRGIVGHVVTTGRTYVADDSAHGDLVEALADDVEGPPAWCFAVQRGTERLGVITAGGCEAGDPAARAGLTHAEKLINQFWIMAADAQKTRTLEQFDPVCQLRSRPAFVEVAEQAIEETYRQGAPVAVAVLAIEGLRAMNDSGRWEIADELIAEVGQLLRAKVRGEDRIGRFDGSRFVVLLRGVDSELATLILRQLIAQVTTLCADSARWGATVGVRCGLAGSGTGQPILRTLISQALGHAQRAREQGRQIGSDVLEYDYAGGTT